MIIFKMELLMNSFYKRLCTTKSNKNLYNFDKKDLQKAITNSNSCDYQPDVRYYSSGNIDNSDNTVTAGSLSAFISAGYDNPTGLSSGGIYG